MRTLVVDALAVARLTRLLSRDKLTEPARRAVIVEAYERANRELPPHADPLDVAAADVDPPMGVYLVGCPWCLSMYVGIGVVAARRLAPRVWDPIATVLAGSYVAGFAAEHE